MDSETIICRKCDSLVPLADNVRGTEHGTFVCPVCHEPSPIGPVAKYTPEQAEIDGPKE
jgi:hypothetical protein